MDKSETRIMEMFIRVRAFGTAHAPVFPATTRGGELFEQLNELISELENHVGTEYSARGASKEGTTLKSVALSELQDDLEAISRTARVLALTTPGLENKFRLPRKARAQIWLAAARAFAADAEPIRNAFIQRGMPANFIEDLNAGTARLEDIIDRKGQLSGQQIAAAAAIDKLIEDGMIIVRELDAIVRNTFRQQPVTLADWISARHVERAPRATAPTTPPPATPPQ